MDDQWVGKAPLKMYEIEAGVEHAITARGDPRYFRPTTLKKTWDKFQRTAELLSKISFKFFLADSHV